MITRKKKEKRKVEPTLVSGNVSTRELVLPPPVPLVEPAEPKKSKRWKELQEWEKQYQPPKYAYIITPDVLQTTSEEHKKILVNVRGVCRHNVAAPRVTVDYRIGVQKLGFRMVEVMEKIRARVVNVRPFRQYQRSLFTGYIKNIQDETKQEGLIYGPISKMREYVELLGKFIAQVGQSRLLSSQPTNSTNIYDLFDAMEKRKVELIDEKSQDKEWVKTFDAYYIQVFQLHELANARYNQVITYARQICMDPKYAKNDFENLQNCPGTKMSWFDVPMNILMPIMMTRNKTLGLTSQSLWRDYASVSKDSIQFVTTLNVVDFLTKNKIDHKQVLECDATFKQFLKNKLEFDTKRKVIILLLVWMKQENLISTQSFQSIVGQSEEDLDLYINL